MWYLRIIIIFLVSSQLDAKFSLKSIVSYVTPKIQEEVVNFDHKLDHHGTVEIENINGDINVKTWTQEKIIIEAVKKGPEKELSRINVNTHLTSHSASIITKHPAKNKLSVTYNVMVPKSVTLKLKTEQGSINVQQIDGPVTAATTEGDISITDAIDAVHAKTVNGDVAVKMRHFKSINSLMLENEDGNIELYLPNATQANVVAKASNGKITSDLYINLKQRTTKLNSQFWDSLKRDIEGKLGNGGGHITMYAMNGNIKLLEY